MSREVDSMPSSSRSDESLAPRDLDMDPSHQLGFSLFPMPPTPPANKQRMRRLLREQQQIANERLPTHPLVQAGQPPPPPPSPSPPPIPAQLRPAPLRLRKKRIANLNHTHPRPTLKVVNPDPPLPEHSVPCPPTRKHHDNVRKPRLGARTDGVPPTPACSPALRNDFPPPPPALPVVDEWLAQKEAESQPPPKRRSHRPIQWLGPNGQVDRKKLSIYLSKVLDSSFEVIDVPDRNDLLSSPTLLSPRLGNTNHWGKCENDQPRARRPALATQRSEDSIISCESEKPRFAGSCHVRIQCKCPPGVALCHSCSSEEFEKFRRRQTEHKTNPSVSSTKCIMSVPRARFRGTLAGVEEPEAPSSPPALIYDSEESEESDWSSPTISSDPSAYVPPLHATPTPAPRGTAMARPNAVSRPSVPSFSLPFTHGRQITPRIVRDSSNYMSGNCLSSSPTSTVPTLASISTISTFAFDFSEKDDETEYDPFDHASELTEIRTYEPIQKARPVLVHCRGPSPHSIKYGTTYSHRSNRSPRSDQVSGDSGYSTFHN